ncbi:type I signal peptidase, putative [Hepatocystis sp. ex Piliocolobus tephrosceles]|nr:type I signal peptidase, putative [Hepatocystis sp. ex Piliocolobus tephrosceles]
MNIHYFYLRNIQNVLSVSLRKSIERVHLCTKKSSISSAISSNSTNKIKNVYTNGGKNITFILDAKFASSNSNYNNRNNISINLTLLKNRTLLLKLFALKKRRALIRIKTRNDKKNKSIFNFLKWNNLLDFMKKIIFCSLVIYGLNNYVFDMTLTSGSSMYPLINKNGVVLFYVCDYTLHMCNKMINIMLYNYVNLLYMCYDMLNKNFKKYRFTNSINKKLTNKIINLKKKIKHYQNIYHRGDIVLLISPVNYKKRVCKRIVAVENDKLFMDDNKSFVEIPNDHIWIEGDNRNDSFDSRNYGYVHVNMIIGRVFFLIDPFKKITFIHRNKNYKTETYRFLHLDK